MVSAITGASCRAYAAWRMSQPHSQFKEASIAPRISPATARRELAILSAALNLAFKEGILDRQVPVTLPASGHARLRWLTRTEVALLLAGALGLVLVKCSDLRTRRERLTIWRRDRLRINRHVARFILIGLYTGTRHDAILRLRWTPSIDAGWIDLPRGLIYRRGDDERRTSKRRPPVPIPQKLAGHFHRARKLTVIHVIEWESKPILKERRAWNSARELAGLGDDVTPHVLRHTCATWLLQNGRPIWEVAGYLGAGEDMIRRVYGHHAPDYLRGAAEAF
jgi:integrase